MFNVYHFIYHVLGKHDIPMEILNYVITNTYENKDIVEIDDHFEISIYHNYKDIFGEITDRSVPQTKEFKIDEKEKFEEQICKIIVNSFHKKKEMLDKVFDSYMNQLQKCDSLLKENSLKESVKAMKKIKKLLHKSELSEELYKMVLSKKL